jgi:8-oxo-dGTP diphosphatase
LNQCSASGLSGENRFHGRLMTFVDVRKIEDPEAQDTAFAPPRSGLNRGGTCVGCLRFRPDGACCPICMSRGMRYRIEGIASGVTQGELIKQVGRLYAGHYTGESAKGPVPSQAWKQFGRKAAVSVIVDEGDSKEPYRVLCVWNPRYKTWALPGGLVEEGETPEQAQRRELEEETGMLTSAAKLVHQGPHGLPHQPGRASIVCVFLVVALGEPHAMEEGCPTQWMTVDDFLAQSKFRDFYAKVLPEIVGKHA